MTNFRPVTDTSFSVEAQTQLEKNKALAALPMADQQRYTDVQTKLAADPTAKLAMQTMLLEGRLPGEKDLRDGQTLLQQLDRLSKHRGSSAATSGATKTCRCSWPACCRTT